MNPFENELRSAMSERAETAGAPRRDVVRAATRRHRRRRGLQAVGATGTLAIVGGFGVAVLAGGQEPVGSTSIDAQLVAMRVADAVDASADAIEYRDRHTTMNGETARLQLWNDDKGRDSRFFGSKVPSQAPIDVAMETSGGRYTVTSVYHGEKTWSRSEMADPGRYEGITAEHCADRGQIPASDNSRCVYSGDAIRAATEGDEAPFEVLGQESIDGRDVLHLRDREATKRLDGKGHVDMWVDADSYELVRTEIVQTETEMGPVTTREDYSYLPRTEANLEKLEAEVPSGYKRVEQDRG